MNISRDQYAGSDIPALSHERLQKVYQLSNNGSFYAGDKYTELYANAGEPGNNGSNLVIYGWTLIDTPNTQWYTDIKDIFNSSNADGVSRETNLSGYYEQKVQGDDGTDYISEYDPSGNEIGSETINPSGTFLSRSNYDSPSNDEPVNNYAAIDKANLAARNYNVPKMDTWDSSDGTQRQITPSPGLIAQSTSALNYMNDEGLQQPKRNCADSHGPDTIVQSEAAYLSSSTDPFRSFVVPSSNSNGAMPNQEMGYTLTELLSGHERAQLALIDVRAASGIYQHNVMGGTYPLVHFAAL